MSKQGNRKITLDLPKTKDTTNRPSVFERLGTKKSSGVKKTSEHCRQWAQHGSCAYGKSCKFAASHVLISPSKQRAANKDSEFKRVGKDDNKNRLHSTVVVRSGEGEIDNWDQNDLEYADADVLEKRRQELQRELELQLKMDGKDSRKDKAKVVTYSSSSRSSSSSSMSSSSSDRSSSSSSSARAARRKGKKGKLKRNSSSSSDDGPPKKKFMKGDSSKRDKTVSKKSSAKKDDRLKKQDSKKKDLSKGSLRKKSLSPSKKSGGTPPISSKNLSKSTSKHNKSPPKRDKRSASKDKDRKERDRGRVRSRSPRKGRSRSPRKHGSRVVSPKKQAKKDGSSDRHRKISPSRDRDRRDHKDKSIERRKDKHDDKDRHDRKDRGRDRIKEKRADSKRRGRDRRADKGLEKPSKPMERLLPPPEERMAALAAITHKTTEPDKSSAVSKDRADSERGGRKQDRKDRESSKRDRIGSMERVQGDYEMDRPYERGRSIDRFEVIVVRGDERYESAPRQDERSPSYSMQGRERHYDSGYDMPAPSRGYEKNDDRIYGDHRGDGGYDDRRGHRDRSWEGRAGSMDREEREYMHPHKEWDNEDYRAGGDWQRDRRWPPHDPQMNEWGDKEQEMDAWHHRGHPGPHRGRPHDNYGRGMRMDGNKRRGQGPRPEPEPAKQTPPPVQTVSPPVAEVDDKPIPDDLSEISDDPDDILNRDDMVDQVVDEDSQVEQPAEEGTPKPETEEKESTQDTSAVGDEKELQEARDDDSDLEEISDGELEEERTRAGLGDALGVDWASLVADVRRREQTAPSSGARNRWKPERVLARVGLSVAMAGKDTVQDILNKNAESLKKEQEAMKQTDKGKGQENGVEEIVPQDVESLHPVGAIQVSMEKRKRHRAVLFGTGCEITRALSARRDLALRRYLCNLPPTERSGQARVTPQPSLFEAARSLFLQASVTG